MMDFGYSKRALLILAVVIALVVGALFYFLFVLHPPETERAISNARQASPAPKQASAELPVSPSEAATPPKLADDETLLCGYGRVKVVEAERIVEKSNQAADRTVQNLNARLAGSKDPREAALGLYMMGSTDTLVAVASGSGDPRVYALALLSCQYTGAGNCAVLSAHHWSDIEPDNAMPWLLEAAAAGPDTDARNRAVIRVSAIKTIR
jgi:hypothetical protein